MDLEDKAGNITFYMTITAICMPGCESDMTSYLEKPHARHLLEDKFSLKHTAKNTDEIGWLQVTSNYLNLHFITENLCYIRHRKSLDKLQNRIP